MRLPLKLALLFICSWVGGVHPRTLLDPEDGRCPPGDRRGRPPPHLRQGRTPRPAARLMSAAAALIYTSARAAPLARQLAW
jgi:hypothetical protein